MDLKSLLERLYRRERHLLWALVFKRVDNQVYEMEIPVRLEKIKQESQ